MNNETLAKVICNKGFNGISGILLRSNFGVGGQISSPQSHSSNSFDLFTVPASDRIFRRILYGANDFFETCRS